MQIGYEHIHKEDARMHKKLARKLFSQNFLHSRKLVKKLVSSSSIEKNDLVLEIGPGKGIITEELVKKQNM